MRCGRSLVAAGRRPPRPRPPWSPLPRDRQSRLSPKYSMTMKPGGSADGTQARPAGGGGAGQGPRLCAGLGGRSIFGAQPREAIETPFGKLFPAGGRPCSARSAGGAGPPARADEVRRAAPQERARLEGGTCPPGRARPPDAVSFQAVASFVLSATGFFRLFVCDWLSLLEGKETARRLRPGVPPGYPVLRGRGVNR